MNLYGRGASSVALTSVAIAASTPSSASNDSTRSGPQWWASSS